MHYNSDYFGFGVLFIDPNCVKWNLRFVRTQNVLQIIIRTYQRLY